MNPARFEIFRSWKNGQWYWRLRACNGRVVAASEGYTRRRDAWRGACATFRAACDAHLVTPGARR